MNQGKQIISENVSFPLRLVRYLSLGGVASRRKAFEIIQSGVVSVNGETVIEPSRFINKDDSVSVNGEKVTLSNFNYVILNKPRGYICTSSDPYADKKAIDLIKLPQYRLFSAGRLDKDSEGLIIFTNDGSYSDKIIHPRNNILKTYTVAINRPLKENEIKKMKSGIQDSGDVLKAKEIKHLRNNSYIFVLEEGKNREIRRLVNGVNAKVSRLSRIAIGALHIGKLPEGKWREMTEQDIKASLQPDFSFSG